MRTLFACCVLLCAFIGSAFADDGDIIFQGETSDIITSHAQLVKDMNRFLGETIGSGEEHITVLFVSFQEEKKAGFILLEELQTKEAWSDYRRKASKEFNGWTYTEKYEGRRTVQMNPNLVTRYFTRDQRGMYTVPSSALWYALGHEFAHAHLYAKGIPEEQHHCYMVDHGVVEGLLAFLDRRDALPFSATQIMRGERLTCEKEKAELMKHEGMTSSRE